MRFHGIERKPKGSGQTGCIGITYVVSRNGRTRTATPRRYFSAHTRRWDGARWRAVNRKFSIDTLGRQEAWRRALKTRAAYEQQVLNAAIQKG